MSKIPDKIKLENANEKDSFFELKLDEKQAGSLRNNPYFN